MLQVEFTRLSWDDLKRELGKVEKPARYVGGEINAVYKDPKDVSVHFALAFPDAYEVGASHTGSQILYSVLNSMEGVACERSFAPWRDMEGVLRRRGWPLYTLESRTPLYAFDIVGFSLQYELTYTNVLAMLDLGGIPLHTRDRREDHPLVVAGGPCAMAPEPLVDFIDAFALGDGEDTVQDIVETYRRWRASGRSRITLLQALSEIQGVYVPSLYEVEYNPDGTVSSIEPKESGGYRARPAVSRRVLSSLEGAPYPVEPVIPLIPPIHDRAVVEIFRGCTQGCRFCQAGTIYRPVRERDPGSVRDLARDILERSGYDEVSLMSLSSADYSFIKEILEDLIKNPCGAKVSLPSLRVDSFSVGLARDLGSSTKTGLTLAPEAGSQRLRDAINKRVTEDEIMDAVYHAFCADYDRIKLYFMIGLPGETDEDVIAIGHLAHNIRKLGRDLGRRPTVVVSVSGFVPKPHTPFQWDVCVPSDEIMRRQRLLGQNLRGPGLDYKYHDAALTRLEAVFARGDRRLSRAVELAYHKGRRFDSWPDEFDAGVWEEAFAESGIDPDFYAYRERSYHEVLPWEHLHSGVSKSYLWQERERSREFVTTPDCRGLCTGCGVCPDLGVEMRIASTKERAQ
ncbi:MAG: TIGR03960 family B12-binding radical SAM protein [Bacillota bacterium]